jgi:rhodanese-related sulfurtransferase
VFPEQLPEFIGNHPILVMAFVGIGIALVVNEMQRFTRGYKAIGPAELTRLINREDALVVDVSALNDFEKGHIVGSKHVAMSQFDPESKLLAKVKDMPVAVVCRTGMTAGSAAKRLVKAGFSKVYWLDGGIAAWQQAELPLAKGKE